MARLHGVTGFLYLEGTGDPVELTEWSIDIQRGAVALFTVPPLEITGLTGFRLYPATNPPATDDQHFQGVVAPGGLATKGVE